MIRAKQGSSGERVSVLDSIGQGYSGGWYSNPCVCPDRYRVYFGGRATKKSEDIMGREPIFKVLTSNVRNVVMMRQNDKDNSTSTFPNIVAILNLLGLAGLFKIYTSPYKIVKRSTGQEIRFAGFNDPSSVLSQKFMTGCWTDTYIEEGSQIPSYEDFRKLDGSMRRDQFLDRDTQIQITMALNPWDVGCWIYDVFVNGRLSDCSPEVMEELEKKGYRERYFPDFDLGKGKGLYLHQSAYTINEFRDRQYDVSANEVKTKAPEIYKVEYLGIWGHSTEGTYPEWSDSLVLPWVQVMDRPYAEFSVGIDTGLSSGDGRLRKDGSFRSATVMELYGCTAGYEKMAFIDEDFISNDGRAKPYTFDEETSMIIAKLREWTDVKYLRHPELMKGTVNVYIDSADIAFRQTLELKARNAGMYMVRFYGSTKLPIQTRVDWWRLNMGMGDLIISDSCANIVREIKSARRDPKTNSCRADGNDHSINAGEYASATTMRRMVRYKDFKEH